MSVLTQPTMYSQIVEAKANSEKLFAVLIDPEHQKTADLPRFLDQIPPFATHIFVGGSTCRRELTASCVTAIKKLTALPLILFPGSHEQLVEGADALLFLSLISGRNPDYLIGEQVKAVTYLRNSSMELIPTGYILINGGNITSVQRVSNTEPMCTTDVEMIVKTALAGQYAGKKLIYLEAGSGAQYPVPVDIVRAVSSALSIPLVVGGGIKDRKTMHAIYEAGATFVVVGTAMENGEF